MDEENEVLTDPEDSNDTPSDDTDDNNEQEETIMADPTPLGKLKRSALLHYLATEFDMEATTPTAPTASTWYLIGKDVEDLSVELNSDTETMKNILDETSVQDNGYEPTIDVDTYYATPTDGAIYTHLKDIMMNRKTGDACRSYILEVIVDQTEGPYDAWVEEVIIKPTSYGGATGGVRIPFNVAFAGNRQKGTVTFSGKVPTFALPQS